MPVLAKNAALNRKKAQDSAVVARFGECSPVDFWISLFIFLDDFLMFSEMTDRSHTRLLTAWYRATSAQKCSTQSCAGFVYFWGAWRIQHQPQLCPFYVPRQQSGRARFSLPRWMGSWPVCCIFQSFSIASFWVLLSWDKLRFQSTPIISSKLGSVPKVWRLSMAKLSPQWPKVHFSMVPSFLLSVAHAEKFETKWERP